MKTKLGLYAGKEVEKMTKEELIEAIVVLGNLYSDLLKRCLEERNIL